MRIATFVTMLLIYNILITQRTKGKLFTPNLYFQTESPILNIKKFEYGIFYFVRHVWTESTTLNQIKRITEKVSFYFSVYFNNWKYMENSKQKSFIKIRFYFLRNRKKTRIQVYLSYSFLIVLRYVLSLYCSCPKEAFHKKIHQNYGITSKKLNSFLV